MECMERRDQIKEMLVRSKVRVRERDREIGISHLVSDRTRDFGEIKEGRKKTRTLFLLRDCYLRQ